MTDREIDLEFMYMVTDWIIRSGDFTKLSDPNLPGVLRLEISRKLAKEN